MKRFLLQISLSVLFFTQVSAQQNAVETSELIPDWEYSFVVTNRSFQSADGFPLKDEEYKVIFKTKK